MTEPSPKNDAAAHSALADAVAAGAATAGTASAPGEASSGEEFMAFRIRGRGYAFRISQVCEVVSASGITAVPHTPAHIQGVINRHGLVTAVFDLAAFRGGETEPSPERLVIIENGDLEAAIPVSQVIGLVTVSADQIHVGQAQDHDEVGVVGELTYEDEVLTIVDSGPLLSASRLHQREGAGA
jgi:purine-binding chemotaxis protein CheW